MKPTKTKVQLKSDDVFVLARLPANLHRYVKSEAALMNKKIADIVIEALTDWQTLRERKG